MWVPPELQLRGPGAWSLPRSAHRGGAPARAAYPAPPSGFPAVPARPGFAAGFRWCQQLRESGCLKAPITWSPPRNSSTGRAGESSTARIWLYGGRGAVTRPPRTPDSACRNVASSDGRCPTCWGSEERMFRKPGGETAFYVRGSLCGEPHSRLLLGVLLV